MSRNPMGGALIGKSRLLEIDAREFVSSHTDCYTAPANALSAHLQENSLFLGTVTGMKIQVMECFNCEFFSKALSQRLFLPRIEAGHLVAETMTRLELECAGGTLLAERQQQS